MHIKPTAIISDHISEMTDNNQIDSVHLTTSFSNITWSGILKYL